MYSRRSESTPSADAIRTKAVKGNALFHDDRHYVRFTQGLADEVLRSRWVVLAYCWMPNHIHALIQTPHANLVGGMQHWLSGYANWYAKRNRRSGRLFQGRYKAFPVEDEGYYWSISRYVHLNPCVGGRPLAEVPEKYPYSSYPGYARKSRRVDWIDYDALHRYWVGRHGGSDPASAYRRYVREGLTTSPDKKLQRLKDSVYGSEDFLRRMVNLASGEDELKRRVLSRRGNVLDVDTVLATTAEHYGVEVSDYCGFRSPAGGRDLAA